MSTTTDKRPRHSVTITKTSTGEVVRRLPAQNQRDAERIASAVMINMDHERFHVGIESE